MPDSDIFINFSCDKIIFSILQFSIDRERLTASVRHFILCGILQERSLSGNSECLKAARVRTAMIRFVQKGLS